MYNGEGSTAVPVWTSHKLRSFKKLAEEAYEETQSDFTFEECLEVFKYFFACYHQYTGRAHPPLKKEQIINIIEKMPYTTSETQEMFDTSPEDYRQVLWNPL